ncbi:MAG: hypothetical protein LBV34_05080 [Nocardiopsaceae bacterium]|jgi:hypothetical protein|nr:hypothetical protein [Nocardiopsaceae bacterium]
MIPGIVAGQMGGSAPAGDPYWDNRVALLHFDGTNGSTTFTDSKGIMTWSAGGTAALTTTDPKFGTAQFNSGSAGYALAAYNAAFNISNQACTFEGFLTVVSLPASFATLLSWNANTGTYAQMRLDLRSDGKLALLVSSASAGTWLRTDDAAIAGGTLVAGTRYFIRIGRDASNNAFIEIDTVAVVSYAAAITVANYSGNTLLGGYQSGSVLGLPVVRWDEVRFSVGRSERGRPIPTAAFPNSL